MLKTSITLAMAADLELSLHFDVPYSPLFNGNEDVWHGSQQNSPNAGLIHSWEMEIHT